MRYSQEAIRKLVEEQRMSGKTVREFCTGRGLKPEAFYVWRQRVKNTRAGFTRVETEESKRVELELSSGIVLRVTIGDLKAVLEALQ